MDKIRLYKNGEVEFYKPKGGKLSLLALDKTHCIIKENGYSGYVHRGIGSVYTSPQFYFYEVVQINNYTEFIELHIKQIWVGESPKDFVQKFVESIDLPEEKYDPLAKYSPAERKQIEAYLKRQDELMEDLEKRIDK